MRPGLAALFLGAFLLLSSPAHAFTVQAENLGPIYPRPEEDLYLIKILAEGFLADKIQYAVVDKNGSLVALTGQVGRYTHKLECLPHNGCLIYDLWGKERNIWNFRTGLPMQERRALFPEKPDRETSEDGKAWKSFISGGNGERIETLFLKDAIRQPFGTFPVDIGTRIRKNFLGMCILSVLILATFYGAARAGRTGRLSLEVVSFISYGLSFIFACVLLDNILTVTPLHFFIIILALAFGFYRLHCLTRRQAS